MIRRINKIKNVGRFVSLTSDTGREGDFTKLNIIYGRNASGKSTLCDLFRSLSTYRPEFVVGRKRFGSADAIDVEILCHGTPPPKFLFNGTAWRSDPAGTANPRILVYDDRFVTENVLIGHSIAVDQRRNLFGFVVGERGILLMRKVEDAEQSLSNATRELNASRIQLSGMIPSGYNIDAFKGLPALPNIDQLKMAASQELEAARRTRQNIDAIRQRRPLQVLNPPTVPAGLGEVLAATLEDAATIAEMKIREHLSIHSRGLQIDWVRQGHIGQLDSACPYCGQEMNGLEILQSYRAFFSGEFQRQQREQEQLLGEIEQLFGAPAQQKLLNVLREHKVEKEWWGAAGELHFELPPMFPEENIIGIMEGARKALTMAVRRKQSSPSVAVALTDDEEAAIGSWRDLYAHLADYMRLIAPINGIIITRQRSASTIDIASIESRIVLLNAHKKRHEAEVVAAYTEYDAAIANKETKEREKVAANEALRQESSKIFEQYGVRINELLAMFQADFRIADAGVVFSGGPPSGKLAIEILGTRIGTTPEEAKDPSKPSLANTISAGDRSALAIAFFIAVVEADPQIADTIVVFDDPFHSQDRSRRSRTIECIQSIALRSKQCFVLSHELDFPRAAARIAGVEVQTFKMDAMADVSVLEADELPATAAQAYLYDYNILSSFLQNPVGTPDQLKNVGRCMRQSLESYLRHKFPIRWRDDEWLGGMIESIRDSGEGDVLHKVIHIVDDLTAVNEYCKRFYHGETDGSDAADIDPKELKSYVEQTLHIISC